MLFFEPDDLADDRFVQALGVALGPAGLLGHAGQSMFE
jgi:hypothetical protein